MTHTQIQQNYWRPAAYPEIEYRATFHSTLSYKRHSHPVLSIGAIFSGHTCLSYSGVSQTLGPQTLVIIPAQMSHSCNPIAAKARSYGMLYLDLPKISLRFASDIKPILTAPKVLYSLDNPELFTCYQTLIQTLKTPAQSDLEIVLLPFLTALLALQPKVHSIRSHAQVIQIKKIIDHNFASPLALSDLAKHVNLRPESVIRLFKRYTGMTPKTYLNNLRIEKAKKRLQQGARISALCYDLGFSDQSHFQHVFRDYCAITPKHYQQNQSIFYNL